MDPLLFVDLIAACTLPSVGVLGSIPFFLLRFLFFFVVVDSEFVTRAIIASGSYQSIVTGGRPSQSHLVLPHRVPMGSG